MQIDLNKAMEECKGIEKIEARNDTGKVSNIFSNQLLLIQRQKFDSATYEKNKQEKEKKQIQELIQLHLYNINCFV